MDLKLYFEKNFVFLLDEKEKMIKEQSKKISDKQEDMQKNKIN